MDAIKKTYFVLFLLALSVLAKAQVYVSNATQLQAALNSAVPGQTIYIQDGYYQRSGGFYANAGIDGTSSNPITVIGSRNVILSTGTLNSSYGFSLKGNQYWIVKGFTVTNSSKGVVLDNCKYITIDSLAVKQIGGEAIHLRTYSSYCTVKDCYIDSTGLNDYSFGEGIYLGSANSNWCTYTNCDPDTCNYNQVLNNSFGNFITAENVDIKEGTKGGLIKGNIFNGAGLQGMNGGDSWIYVKGNYYTIEDNVGSNSILDGFQTHIQPPGGYGDFNTFRNNVLNANAPGYGINVKTSSPNGTASHNIVCSDNQVSGTASGLTNISVTVCQSALSVGLLNWNAVLQNSNLVFTWKISSSEGIDKFIIEASSDSRSFSPLLEVPVAATEYMNKVAASSTPGSYYRLAIQSKDGKLMYSKVIEIAKKDGAFHFTFSNDKLVVYCSETNSRGILFDQLGKIRTQYNQQAGYNYLNITRNNQVYFLSLSDSRQQKCFKLFL